MDKSQAKKYSKIAVTLGVIAGGSALLIGLANIITAGPIAQNELNKKLESIKVVYGEDATYGDEVMISDEYKEAYPSLISYYNAKDASGADLGHVFVTEGKNNFGKIKMAIGIDIDDSFGKVSMIINEQTLPNEVNAYVDGYNKGERDFNDVKCGATFGATLINDMGKEALSYYKAVIKNETPDPDEVPEYLSKIFGENVNYGEEKIVENTKYPFVKGYHTATTKNGNLLGYVFICDGKRQEDFGPIKMSIGIKADNTIGKIYIIENGQTNGKDKVVQSEYVDKVNSGDRNFDDVNCGATFGATLINTMGKQALMFVKAEINQDLTDFEPYLKETFGAEVNYIRRNNVIDAKNGALKEFWTAMDANNKTVGRAYHAELNNNHFMIGISKAVTDEKTHQVVTPQALKSLYWVNKNDTDAGKAALAFIEKLNKGEETLEDNAADNAIIKDGKAVAKQALDHAANNMITDPVDVSDLLPKTFGSDVSYCEHTVVDDINYSNILEYWNVKDNNRDYLGRAYHLEAPGQHGSVHVVVGVVNDPVNGGKFHKIATNNQIPTFNAGGQAAHDALDAYIAGLNNGTIDINNADDVENGATGTSTGLRNLALLAVKHYGNNILANEFLPETFGNDASYVEHNYINEEHVYESWNVIGKDNAYLGRVYHTRFEGRHATINALVSFKPDTKLNKIYLINRAPGEYGDKLANYVDLLNKGYISIHDDVHNGASASSSAVATMAREAEAHLKVNPILPMLTNMDKIKGLFTETNLSFEDHRMVTEKGFENVVEYWTVKDADGKPIAGAYHCALPGKHAIMEITVSVYQKSANGQTTSTLGKVMLLNKAPNEYGDILQSYVDGLNDGSIDINDDVHNGATGSSTGVQGMVKQCLAHSQKNLLDAGMNLTAALKNTFGENANYGEATPISSVAFDNLLESWDAKDGEGNALGRVYHASLPGEHATLHVLVAVNVDGSLNSIYWANNNLDNPYIPPNVKKYARLAQEYIDELNAGNHKLTDDVHNGATGTTGGIISLAEQALEHYELNKIVIGG